MNVTASAALALLVLFSSQAFAEQTPSATQQNNRDAMILPSAHATTENAAARSRTSTC